jgi:hypothetical protein
MKNIICLAVALLVASTSSAAPQVVVTSFAGGTKGGSTFAMDIISDVNYKAFQFDIDVAGASDLDLTACTSGVTAKVTLSCKKIAGDKVRVFAVDINGVGTEIPAGKMAIGMIKFNGAPSLSVSNLEFADKAGEVIQSTVTSSEAASK